MDRPWAFPYPASLPPVRVAVSDRRSGASAVRCEELQWWFVVPRAGDTSGAAWYDRDTGLLTRVRETAAPVTDADNGSVRIDIDEWSCEHGPSDSPRHERITFNASLTADRAEFRGVTMGGCRLDAAELEAGWSGVGPCLIVDDGRYEALGANRYRTTTASGMGAGVVTLQVGPRSFQCLRVLDLPTGSGEDEIGQALIDLGTGRTLAYWQYRPSSWDTDATAWLADHPGTGLTIDDLTYQRRNCTGRDEIALTTFGLPRP